MKNAILFSGTSNEPLANDIAHLLDTPLGTCEIAKFADGEVRPWIEEDVRDKTVFVIQSFSQPMNDHIMEFILMGDAIRRGAPKRLIAVVPYFGYARQDKQHRVGEPVSARIVAKMLEVVPFHEVITIDLHNDAIVGFFRNPVVHLSALPTIGEYIKKMDLSNSVIISPDVGGVRRTRNMAFDLGIPMVVMEKRRQLDKTDTSDTYQIIGDVKGKNAIIVDDIISTGGTIVHSVESLKEAGANTIYVAASHGVFAGNASEKLLHAPIEEMIVSDTIKPVNLNKNVHVVPIAPLLASAIKKIAG
jgi:ribose-phosphate pyrophosphokinase